MSHRHNRCWLCGTETPRARKPNVWLPLLGRVGGRLQMIGVACCEGHAESAHDLMRFTEQQMTREKGKA